MPQTLGSGAEPLVATASYHGVSIGMGPAVHSSSTYGWPACSRITCVVQPEYAWRTSVTTGPSTTSSVGVTGLRAPGKKSSDELGRNMYAPDFWFEHGGSRRSAGTSSGYSVQPPTLELYQPHSTVRLVLAPLALFVMVVSARVAASNASW